MRFHDSGIAGCVVVDVEEHVDERGSFARTWCEAEFEGAGLPTRFVQASISRNTRAGTLRGMHYQRPPSQEGKLVRCVRGAVLDVVVDIRQNSATFLQHFAVELSATNARALFIPPGCAHGFQTLADATDVYYQMTDFYAPELAASIRWNDPALGLSWPTDVTCISERDANVADLDTEALRDLKWNS